MTNDERLGIARELIEQVWKNIVPDRPPITVAEDEYFDMVDGAASRILDDIQKLHEFTSDVENTWR